MHETDTMYIRVVEAGLVPSDVDAEALFKLQIKVSELHEKSLRHSLSTWKMLAEFLQGRSLVLYGCIRDVQDLKTRIEISKEEQLRNLNPMGAGTAAAWTMSARRRHIHPPGSRFVVALLSSISLSSFIAPHPRIYAASSTSNGFNDLSVTTAAAWGTYILTVLVIGPRLYAFEHPIHEAFHNNLFTNLRAGKWLEFTYVFPVSRLLKESAQNDPVWNSDVVRFIDYGSFADKSMSAWRKTWLMFGFPFTTWFHYECMSTLPCSQNSGPTLESRLLGRHPLCRAFCDAWGKFGRYYAVPWFEVLPVMRWWAELEEYLGTDMTQNFGSARISDDIQLVPLGLHAAPHLNSQVPFHRLRQAHTQLMSEGRASREKSVTVVHADEIQQQVEGVAVEWVGKEELEAV
ncbi:hypothetical protein C8J57DRAFT_1558797 [Mycena rebaudengoi]|nr:hypothetical protein C8J57DRAFT_1558797 [Mycena rebaudengoi]